MPDISSQDRDLVARTILSEAQNDGESGMAAVAHVIKNRTESGKYGETPGDVVLQRKQFEPWNRSRSDTNHPSRWSTKSEDYQRAAQIVDSVWKGQIDDPTGGATHFFSPRDQAALGRKAPEWGTGKPLASVGHHQFFAPDGPVVPDLLGHWGGQSGASAVASADAPDDLLSSWAKAVPAAPAALPPATPVSVKADMPVPLPGQKAIPAKSDHPETIPEYVNRLMAGAHGHGDAHLSDLVTGKVRGDSWGDTATQLGAGALRGVGDVADTLAQGVAYAGEKGANLLQRGGIIAPETAAKVADWRSGVNADIAANNAAFTGAAGEGLAPDIGRVGGQIVGTGPFLAAGGGALTAATRGAPLANALAARPLVSAAVGGAAAGAGANALTSASSDTPLGEQMAQGAVAGSVLGPVGHLVGRAAGALGASGVDRATADLAAAAHQRFGIPIRVDQLSSNPMVRFAGSVLQRLPFTGVGAHAAEQQTTFNRAIAHEMGEYADRITRPVIRQAQRRIGDVFDDVARRTGDIHVDGQFATHVTNIVHDARSVLGRDAAPIENQVRRVLDRVDANTRTLSPESYQSLTRKDTPLSRAQQSTDPNVRHYANQLRNALDDMMERSAPADAVADLREARYQWAVTKAMEPLAKKAATGDISPALLLAKTKGGALEQLGQIGQRFLKEPPSSGTAERLAVMKTMGALAAGAGGLGGAYLFDPENFQRDAAVLGGGILAARGGGALLRNETLAAHLIGRGQNLNPRRMNALSGRRAAAAGALINRANSQPLAATP